jgi:putative nucleotidyltransferase with HDIG domain
MSEQPLTEIPLTELSIGTYVVAVINESNNVRVKSEGYILKPQTIERMKQSGIKRVVIDPTKQKKLQKNADVAEKITSTSLRDKVAKTNEGPKVPLELEIKKAEKLYGNAKALQHKLLEDITNGKIIDVDEVKQSSDAIVDSIFKNQDALLCMSRLRIKDEYLIEHSLNVSILMTIFAKSLGIDRTTIEQLALGAFLHDVGKILVPDHILHKPGRLTPEEFEEMKKHVNYGLEVLADLPNLSDLALSLVREHHERLDGNGYPNQLPAEKISQYSRMIAIVDSYDAMTAERVYKAGMHPIKAFRILVKESPNSFDNELVEKFIQCLGLYPVGTLVKLTSGKLGIISRLNKNKPLKPFVRVFYNTRLKQNIAIEELDLSQPKYNDEIECCVKPEEFNINLMKFFKAAFIG